jgi:hypothetical protein
MQYLWIKYLHDEEDEPTDVYSELDENRREVRKVEFFRHGICFSYGGERGSPEALSQTPYPEDLRSLNLTGEREVRSIPFGLFLEVWNQAQERPDAFMGMFV